MNRLRLLKAVVRFEYEDPLDSGVDDGIGVGTEVRFLEMAALRFWHFTGDLGEPGDDTGDRLERTTFGFGLGVPLYRFTGERTPLNISVEWAHIDSRIFLEDSTVSDDHSAWTLALDWHL
jgi:hypothetical protein